MSDGERSEVTLHGAVARIFDGHGAYIDLRPSGEAGKVILSVVMPGGTTAIKVHRKNFVGAVRAMSVVAEREEVTKW